MDTIPHGQVAASGETVRERLHEERRRILAVIADIEAERTDDLGSVTDASTLGGSRQHLADIASELYERERGLGLAEDFRAELAEVDAAFLRVDAGTYGVCVSCACVIDEARLAAMPAASRCVNCQAKAEVAASIVRRAADATPSNVTDHDDMLQVGDAADDEQQEARDTLGPEDRAMTIRSE